MLPDSPPKFPLKFLRWFCAKDRLEEVEGDLYEVWWERREATNQSKANLLYWWLVFRSLRRFALKRNQTQYKSGFIMFFGHHLKVTYRNLRKHKVTTAINILGLAIGISAFIAIMNVVNYEHSFNHHLPNDDRIYRVYTRFTRIFKGQNRGVSTGLVPYLRENEPEIKQLPRFLPADLKVHRLMKPRFSLRSWIESKRFSQTSCFSMYLHTINGSTETLKRHWMSRSG